MAAYVDTQEALLAWIAETLATPHPAAATRPAGEPIPAQPDDTLAILDLADRGDPGSGGPFFIATGFLRIYGPGDITAQAVYDSLLAATMSPDGWQLRSGIQIAARWYALYIRLGGAHVEVEEGWPVLICTITAAVDRKRGA